MHIKLAKHLGMCFGVRDAIAFAKTQSRQSPLTTLGDLVHNQGVLRELNDHGVRSTRDFDQIETSRVMITAHGSSDSVRQALDERRHEVLDATCPLVHHAHRLLTELVASGHFPLVIGKPGHVEVKGLTGDLEEFRIISGEADLEHIPPRPRYGVVAQTTQPIERVRSLVAALRERFPSAEVAFRDTVCQPTKNRQKAAKQLATESDVVIVIGGARSNNTHELYALCSRHCSRVYHIQRAEELREEWFFPSDLVGVTAGTSTPDDQIRSVVDWLEAWIVRSDFPARLSKVTN